MPLPLYEYATVKIQDHPTWSDQDVIQHILDEYSNDGWRLVQTVESMGYTVQFIFERPRNHESLDAATLSKYGITLSDDRKVETVEPWAWA